MFFFSQWILNHYYYYNIYLGWIQGIPYAAGDKPLEAWGMHDSLLFQPSFNNIKGWDYESLFIFLK